MPKRIVPPSGSFLTLLAIFLLLIGFAVISFLPAGAAGEVVTGRVTYPNGSPASGVQLELHLADGTISHKTSTDATGNYAFSQTLTPGLIWYLAIQPPTGYDRPSNSPYAFTYQTGDATRTADFQLISASKVITGRVTYDDGSNVSDADIDAYPAGTNGTGKIGARTGSDGTYTMNVRGGTWFVNAVANLSEQNVRWIVEATPVAVMFNSDDSSETQTVNFQVTRATGNLKAVLLNSDGSKLTTGNFVADIDVRRADGIGTIRKVASADSSLNIFLTPGIYRLCAYHQDLNGTSFDPDATTFVMTENGSVDLGTIQAVANAAHLKGRVVDAKGRGLNNVALMAFSSSGCSRPTTNTDATGSFDLTVGAGTWTVGLNVTGGKDSSYSQTAPVTATVKNGQTVSGLTLAMKTIDRTVNGRVLSSAGTVITDFVGVAYLRTANGQNRVSAPVVDGAFSIEYAAAEIPDRNLLLGVLADPGAGYSGSREVRIKVSGTTTTKDVTVAPYDATITGTLRLADGTAVSDTSSTINVYAMDDDGNFASTTAAADGTYTLTVAAGTWFVNYDIDDPSDTANLLDRPVGEDRVTVKAGATTTKNLTILRGTNTINGTVRDAERNPVSRAKITVDNRPRLENNADANPNAVVTATVESDEAGAYSVKVPNGTFLVTVGDTPSVGSDDVQPDGKSVTVSGGATKTVDLRFENADAVITGTVQLNKKVEGGGTVTAWSKDGAQRTATVDSKGRFTLNVTSGETWSLLASDLTGTTLAASDVVEVKPKAGATTKNLILEDTEQKAYGPVTKSFDAAEPGSVSLPDGTTVSVPSRALDLSGTVSLTVTPVIDPDPTTGDVAAGLTYEVKATDADGYELKRLNAPATIVIPYPQDNLGDKGLREKTLGTKFFNPETKTWEEAAGFVNTTENVAKLTTLHLTKFSVTGSPKPAPRIDRVSQKSVSGSQIVLEIRGANFTGKPRVTLGGVTANQVVLQNGGKTLLATFDVRKFKAGTVNLTVKNGNGREVTKEKIATLVKRGNRIVPQGL